VTGCNGCGGGDLNGWCEDTKYPIVNHHTTGFERVERGSSLSLKEELLNGPVSISIEADQPVFHHYSSGVINPADCGTVHDHAVLAIGFGN
jgi:hypothetical protein